MSYDLAVKRRVFLSGVLVFVGLMVVAWFSRPGSLREQIEHQGIHLTETSVPSKGVSLRASFSIPRHELPTLKAWLSNEGFETDNGSSVEHHYFREHRVLNFFRQKFQTVKIFHPDDGSVTVYLTDR